MKIYLLKRIGKLSKANIEKGRSKKISLYFMYHYGPHQRREYEWLDLFLYEKPKNQIEKDHNKETLLLAENIRAKRLLDEQSTSHGFISRVKSRICFLTFFKSLVDKKESVGNRGNWLSTYGFLIDFTKRRSVPIDTVDERFLESFKEYLLNCKTRRGYGINKLNPNSINSYLGKINASMKIACKDRLINKVITVRPIKGKDSHRDYLTIEELQKLAETPSENPLQKKLFLTSALCGLRFSDLKNLRWENINHSDKDGYYIQYTQQKTQKAEMLPIADHVVAMLGEIGHPSDLVFDGITYSAWENKKLKKWIKNAGISKPNITMHNARHTYACLQISYGTDLYVVSKLLGHRSLSTTQIYAKVMDVNKIKAANMIPQLNITS